MSLELHHVRRVRLYEEAAGSANFAQEHSGTIGDFWDLRTNSAEMSTGQAMLRDERLVQTMFNEPLDVLGAKACSLSLETYLRSDGTGLPAGSTPSATAYTALGRLLKVCMGGFKGGGDGSNEDAGTSTVSVLNVTAADGAEFSAGSALGATVAGYIEAREIASISADAITPKVKFSAAPTSGGSVLNSYTYYLTDDPATSLQAICESNERDDIWWLLGLQGSMSVTFANGELVKVGATLGGVDWSHDDEVGTPIGSTLGVADYTGDDPGDPIPFLNSEVILADASGAAPFTRRVLDQSSITLTFNWSYEPVPATSGVNGVRRWRMRPNRPAATAQIVLPFNASDPGPNGEVFWDARANRTRQGLFIQAGRTAGNTVLVTLPNCQVMDVQRADSDGLIGQTISLKALEDEDSTDATTELRRSPVRIHQL